MEKVAIIYWSGTGNTEAMAHAVEEGVQSAGAEAEVFYVGDISADEAAAYDRILLGCPAQGTDELEGNEFAPFFEELLPSLSGKKVGIFGSYEWHEGGWLLNWKEQLESASVTLAAEPVKAYGYPDDEALDACKELGKAVAKA